MTRALISHNKGTGTVEITLDLEKPKEVTRIYVGFRLTDQEAIITAIAFLQGLIAYGKPKLEGFRKTEEVMLSRDPHCVEGRERQSHNLALSKELDWLQGIKDLLCAEVTDQSQLSQEPMSLENMRRIGHYLPSWFNCQMRYS